MSRIGSEDEVRPRPRKATFRFYAELVDLLRVEHSRGEVTVAFDLPAGVKDLIESCGVPHTEVDLIVVDGESVDFGHRVDHGDRVAVYPVFESFDIEPILRVRPHPLRVLRFVADNHLARLARHLRLLGFDTVHDPGLDDEDLVRVSQHQRRILLTRDRELLKHGSLTHGYYVRATDPRLQLVEVARRFHLEERLEPYSRCTMCNTPIDQVGASGTATCPGCGRVYWRGSHITGLERIIASVREDRGR